jgi:hypothetical protein
MADLKKYDGTRPATGRHIQLEPAQPSTVYRDGARKSNIPQKPKRGMGQKKKGKYDDETLIFWVSWGICSATILRTTYRQVISSFSSFPHTP